MKTSCVGYCPGFQDLRKPVLQPHRNQSVVRQPTAFKSERPRITKPRFASQVDVNNDLSKPVTTHYLPKERESIIVKPHHVIASSESRNSSKNMPIFSSNDMVHNHYLEEAKKKTQGIGRNSRPSVMPSTISQSTANVGLRWVPTGKIFTSSTTKADSEPTNGSNADITNQYECEQTLDVSAVQNLEFTTTTMNRAIQRLVSKVVPPADKTATSRQELELLFHHHITMLSTTTPADNSLLEYDSFLFEIEPDQGELTSVVMEDILGEPHVHVPNVLPTHPTLMLDSDFIPFDDSLGSDLKVSFPSGTRNKIFDPGIFFEVQSKKFLSWDTFSISFIYNFLCPLSVTLLPFSSENEDKVFNPGLPEF
nr:hypothetical protein [Tanacetum cinerariifolium]